MATGTEGTSTVTAVPTIGDEIAEMFGDYSGPSESPEPSEPSETGAPPVDPAPPASDPALGSEGTAAQSEPAGAPPAGATAPVLDEIDPLDGATALTYTVNGESRAYDGIKVLKGGGAIIEPDHLAKLQQRLSERDHLFEKDRESFEKLSDLERATTWQTRDSQGNVKTLTGREAVWESRAMLARSAAAVKTINDVFTDPQKFAALVGVDENNQLIVNPQGLMALRDRVENASLKAVETARTNFGSVTAKPAPAEPDISTVAAPTIEQYVTQYAITGLTADDKAFLAGQLGRYVTTTPTGRAVDPSFLDVMKDRAALRMASATAVSAAGDAARVNAARMAAAANGKRPAPTAPTRAPTAKPANQSQDALWSMMERRAAGMA